jgi:hypothetical protein
VILRRLTASLRAQNWTAIAIELLIVVVGVFIGTQVSNWNEARIEKRQTAQLLEQLRPELDNQLEFFESARIYYRTARPYADRALAAWAGNRAISDNDFVIAAYQASQIYGIGINAQNWALAFGGDRLRDVADQRVRKNIAVVLTADYESVGFNAVATPYREHVRQVIPAAVQDHIRASCDDKTIPQEGSQFLVVLPPTCPLVLPPAEAAMAAAALRAHPELVPELNWHLAAVAGYLSNVRGLEGSFRSLKASLDEGS